MLMYVAVQHSIFDPASFWDIVEKTPLPSNVILHHTFPSTAGDHAICIWEAETVEAVRSIVEQAVGNYSRNEYFQVENKQAIAKPVLFRSAA